MSRKLAVTGLSSAGLGYQGRRPRRAVRARKMARHPAQRLLQTTWQTARGREQGSRRRPGRGGRGPSGTACPTGGGLHGPFSRCRVCTLRAAEGRAENASPMPRQGGVSGPCPFTGRKALTVLRLLPSFST